jgi:phosphoglucomutase
MMGDYVRDKDAVTASMLLTEMAAWYADQGMTLFDAIGGALRKIRLITLKKPTIW